MILSVIIVAYKNWAVLIKNLKSIEQFNDIGKNLEVIIVDNSPENERVLDKIKNNWKFSFKYIANENRGFGYGNNVGVEISEGKYLAFINPDVIFIEPIFEKIVNEFDKNDCVSMIGIRLLDENHKINSSFKYDFKYSFLSRQIIKYKNWVGKYDEKTMYIEGADIFIRKEDFIAAGKFDENLFMYYEEADLIRRLRRLRGEHHIRFFKNLHLIHLENGNTPDSVFAVQQEINSCLYFSQKYGLNAKKKLMADYTYLKFKYLVYKILGKENQYIKQALEIYEHEIEKIER